MVEQKDFQENEAAFLTKIRTALSRDTEQKNNAASFRELFASRDDRQLLQRINDRNDLDFQGLVAALTENAKPLNLSVHTAATLADAADIVTQLAREQSPEFGTTKQIVQHDHPDICNLRLWEHFAAEPISVHTTYQADPEIRKKTESSFIGITAADWGVAESATVLHLTKAGRPRSTSLVPAIHIALLRRDRLLANLTETYAMLRQDKQLDSVTFISGPSKTADIEAHMVHGAHGPREMHIIVVTETPAAQ